MSQKHSEASAAMSLVSVVAASPLPNLSLKVEFSDGASGTVDVRDLLSGPVFQPLFESDYFDRVRVDSDLGTVTWPNGADLSPGRMREILNRDDLSEGQTELAPAGQIRISLNVPMQTSQLHYGDNLLVMKERIESESVDLVYLDPPFNSNRSHNALFKTSDGETPGESVLAFRDFWTWNEASRKQMSELLAPSNRLSTVIRALHSILDETDLMAYLVMMAPRLVELRRSLKPTGSIYLHCDQRVSHYLKVLMDAIFGGDNFLNNVVWLYGLGGSSPRYWPRKHDDILWYSKSPDGHYFDADKVPSTSRRMAGKLKKAPDYWDIPSLNNMAKERLGYPTQKPLELLERVVRSSCPEGGVVLDPFCGCGTTIEAAEKLGRKWVGIDVSYLAVDIVQRRLSRTFHTELGAGHELFGQPSSASEAVEMYHQQRLDFGYWVMSMLDAEPRGINAVGHDGVIRFPMREGEDEGLAGVLLGGTNALEAMDLAQRMIDDGSTTLGVVVLLDDASPFSPFTNLPAWRWPVTGHEFPVLQTLTVEQLLDGERPKLPTVLTSHDPR